MRQSATALHCATSSVDEQHPGRRPGVGGGTCDVRTVAVPPPPRRLGYQGGRAPVVLRQEGYVRIGRHMLMLTAVPALHRNEFTKPSQPSCLASP